MNKQKAKPVNDSPLLAVNEIFYSIQGEGPFAGKAAVFIRLAGCNLQCPECDTEYSEARSFTPERILAIVKGRFSVKSGALIVITGGEPFRQAIGELVALLHLNYFQIQIETNGTIFPDSFPWSLCTVVCSPKGKVHPEMLPRIDAFKYVAAAGQLSSDGLPVNCLGYHGFPARPNHNHNKPIYLQPLDEKDPFKNKANQEAVFESCLTHGHILCLQLHKLIDKE